jgi:hypothetical protein
MPDALDTVDRIGRALGVLDGSENEDGQWFAECLRQWLAGADWEGAVGLPDDWRGAIERLGRQRQQPEVVFLQREAGDHAVEPSSASLAADALAQPVDFYCVFS